MDKALDELKGLKEGRLPSLARNASSVRAAVEAAGEDAAEGGGGSDGPKGAVDPATLGPVARVARVAELRRWSVG